MENVFGSGISSSKVYRFEMAAGATQYVINDPMKGGALEGYSFYLHFRNIQTGRFRRCSSVLNGYLKIAWTISGKALRIFRRHLLRILLLSLFYSMA